MLEVGVAVVRERVATVVCVDRGVVSRADDVCRRHAEVAVFVETSGMFYTSVNNVVEW